MPSLLSRLLSCLIVAALCAATGFDDRCVAEEGEAFFADHLQPFLQKYCIGCHSGEEPKADFALDTYHDTAALRRDRDQWSTVVEYIEAGIMPPAAKPQPTADEVAVVSAWVNGQLARIGAGAQRDPGRVTIRRLNRAEYNNTIRDLIGIDVQPADEFPSDDVGYGFDNIGDVLSLPPLLMEKYLAAAEKIADEAIALRWPPEPVKHKFAGRRLSSGAGSQKTGQARRLGEEGEAYIEMRFALAGDYILRCRAYAEQAGDEPVRMALCVDGKKAETFEVQGTKAEPAVYEKRIEVARGVQRVAAAFLNDFVDPDNPDPAQRDRNLVVESLEIEGPFLTAEQIPAPHRRIIFRQPTGSEDEDPCAREILTRLASRAYRRPAASDEVEALAQLVRVARENGDSFEAGIQLGLQAILVSPHFLFRVELDADTSAEAPVHTLDDYQLASRLSYFLWSSMPDDELFRLAAEGALSRPENLATQVKRMLADPKSRALVRNFAGQWLQLRNLDLAAPDRSRFKKFDEKLRAAMKQETELFFENIVREDRSVLDFLDADYTFVNERLAKHYGINGVSGDEFRRITLDDRRRGGVLTQASILTITSNPTRTSPVKRGKWIMEQILGTPPPPPPPGVAELEQVALFGSLREKIEQHRENPSCAVCHERMDPLGFALENFNAVGAWRDTELFVKIDASGTMPGGQTFEGPADFRALLKSKPEVFARCLTRKLLTYALGRGLEAYDAQAVAEITKRLQAEDYKFSTLVTEVVGSEPFRMRRAQGVTQ